MNLKTCKITFGPNFTKQQKGRPNYNRYNPSRKRRLEKGLPVGCKTTRRQFSTA